MKAPVGLALAQVGHDEQGLCAGSRRRQRVPRIVRCCRSASASMISARLEAVIPAGRKALEAPGLDELLSGFLSTT